jgi:sulfatase modifying factor 1
MGELDRLLEGIAQDADSGLGWLVLADWLEEHDDPLRAELVRLRQGLVEAGTTRQDSPQRREQEARLLQLLVQGVKPCGPSQVLPLGKGGEMNFTWIAPGSFLMGSPPSEEERSEDESQHRVTLTQGYWLGVTPVTQSQWQAVMGNHPSRFPGGDRPVEQVSWEDCQRFCARLKEKTGQTCRLPTEAQWEYACRAGTTTPFSFGETISTDQANYNGNYTCGRDKKGVYRQQTTPMRSFPANAWGLYDMHGNVWEWCADWYGPYPEEDIKDPINPINGDVRVLRGGSWRLHPHSCRAACRGRYGPDRRDGDVGCRLVLCLD